MKKKIEILNDDIGINGNYDERPYDEYVVLEIKISPKTAKLIDKNKFDVEVWLK